MWIVKRIFGFVPKIKAYCFYQSKQCILPPIIFRRKFGCGYAQFENKIIFGTGKGDLYRINQDESITRFLTKDPIRLPVRDIAITKEKGHDSLFRNGLYDVFYKGTHE
jgi:hypothetical protein